MGKIGNIVYVDVEKLVPYAKNSKQHPEEQVQKIADSIKEFGFISPCLIDGDNNIIAGHGRVLASKMLGLEQVPCLYVEGLTEEQRRAYIIADNRLTELGEWNKEVLSEELSFLKENNFDIEITGFDVDSIIVEDDLSSDLTPEEASEKYSENDYNVQPGQIWALGRHRLMCGDSTSASDVCALMGKEQADLLVTDPPYNVAVSNALGDTIANDDMKSDEFLSFLEDAFSCAYDHMKPGCPFYVWYASSNSYEFSTALKGVGLKVRQELIWVKNQFTLGRQDYQWKHEPCLYGWKEGAGHFFVDSRILKTVTDNLEDLTKEELIELIKDWDGSSVIYEDKPVVDDLHPTMKPIHLFKRHIMNSSKPGDIVLDLFGGSGTTLMACQDLERSAYLMEYDPKYANAILCRFEECYGIKPQLIGV